MYKRVSSILIFFILSTQSFSTNYYVAKNDPAASDSNPGTEILPFLTIQKGIDTAQPGDTVFVKEGLYMPGVSGLRMRRSGAPSAKIVFTAFNVDSVTVQFPPGDSLVRGWWWDWASGGPKDYLAINGFEIKGAKYAILIRGDYNEVTNCKVNSTIAPQGDAVCIWGGNHNLIAHNEIWNSGWNGIYVESRVEGGDTLTANYNIVEYNVCHDSPGYIHFGMTFYPEAKKDHPVLVGNIIRYNTIYNCYGAIYMRYFKDGEIYGNLFYNNGVTSPSPGNNGLFLDRVFDATMEYPFRADLKIYNNTFVNNAPFHTINNIAFTYVEIKNNIFVQSYGTPEVRIVNTEGNVLNNNIYYNTSSATIVKWGEESKTLAELQLLGQELNGMDTDPLLDANYRPTASSPAIDAGENLGAPYNYDLEGNIRGKQFGWDIGAFETDFPLPVELNLFTYKILDNYKIKLIWLTETESENYGFEIERTINRKNRSWKTIGFVNGYGNSNSPKHYSFVDENPVGGSDFIYRLKQIDTDGSFKYLPLLEISLHPNSTELYQNYPNPFNPETKIKFSLPFAADVSIDIFNSNGEFLTTIANAEFDAGFHIVTFNADIYASGIYLYRLKSGNISITKKLLLIK